MKIFVSLLMLANLLGCGWIAWQQRHITPALPEPPVLTFVAAQQELQILNVANATEHVARTDLAAVDGLESVESVATTQIGVQAAIALPEAGVPEKWCGISAAFETDIEANSWLSEWVRLGGGGSVAQSDEPVSSTWWVHLPPFPTESEARIVLNGLQEKKIDSFYMRTGDLAGGISLGVFSRKESAFLVQADLATRGYTASVKEIQRMAKRFKIALDLPNAALFQAPEVRALLSSDGSGEVREIPCR